MPASVKLVRIQALSGVEFAVFLSLYLANTAAASSVQEATMPFGAWRFYRQCEHFTSQNWRARSERRRYVHSLLISL
jgi:hypothetical protein